MVSASAWWLAACLRPGSLTGFLLTAYVVAWVEVVTTALLLSAFDAFARPGILAGLAVWLAAGYGVWILSGRPPPAAGLRARLAWLRAALRRPHLALLAIVLMPGYAYLVALGLFTPQNDGDPLAYQLTRAALWRQHESIEVFSVPQEPRLDVNPIVAELGQSTSLVLAGSERFV